MVNPFKTRGTCCHLLETIKIHTFSNGSFSSVTPYDGIVNHGITNAAHPRKSLMIKCKWRFMVFYSRDSHWEKIRHRSQGKHTSIFFSIATYSWCISPSRKNRGNWQMFLERIRNSIPRTEITYTYIYNYMGPSWFWMELEPLQIVF